MHFCPVQVRESDLLHKLLDLSTEPVDRSFLLKVTQLNERNNTQLGECNGIAPLSQVLTKLFYDGRDALVLEGSSFDVCFGNLSESDNAEYRQHSVHSLPLLGHRLFQRTTPG